MALSAGIRPAEPPRGAWEICAVRSVLSCGQPGPVCCPGCDAVLVQDAAAVAAEKKLRLGETHPASPAPLPNPAGGASPQRLPSPTRSTSRPDREAASLRTRSRLQPFSPGGSRPTRCPWGSCGPGRRPPAGQVQPGAARARVDQIARWSLGTRRSSNTDTADESTVMGHVVKGEKQ
ncbi:hypothetical protein R6Z07F_001480 [Ovis aries]